MENVKERIHQTIDRSIESGFCAGASLLVLKNGEEKLYAARGFADKEQGVPIRRDTLFRLYSMSKPITGCAAMILLERGVLDLYEPVSNYLPGFEKCRVRGKDGEEELAHPVRIRDLLSMTSGLTYGDMESDAGRGTLHLFSEMIGRLRGGNPMTTVEFANRLGENGLCFQPGSHWRYGTSAEVMGAVIEKASGISFGEFLHRELFEPLGMKDTGFFVPEEKKSRLTKIYEETSSGVREYPTDHLGICYDMNRAPAFESGGAGLVSTLDDYAQFARMLMGGGTLNGRTILQPATVRFFTGGDLSTVQQEDFTHDFDGMAGYTYGNFMRVMKNPGLAYANAGRGAYGWDGWLGPYFANDPENGLTFLMMLQRRDAGTVKLTRQLIDIVTAAYGNG